MITHTDMYLRSDHTLPRAISGMMLKRIITLRNQFEVLSILCVNLIMKKSTNTFSHFAQVML
jgi:hypothetical protein